MNGLSASDRIAKPGRRRKERRLLGVAGSWWTVV